VKRLAIQLRRAAPPGLKPRKWRRAGFRLQKNMLSIGLFFHIYAANAPVLVRG
jgi:hypothetical protein